ncbi:MAG: hydroxymethylglutaryl-CoA lyase [Gemmatimonadota bacterium]
MTGDVVIHEVGPRDGLQMEKTVVPFERKLAWIRGLVASGLDIVQVGSFVHPAKVPQMADTDRLFTELRAGPLRPGVVLSGLVLNEKGMERGEAVGVDLYCMGVSASETHSRKNTGMPIAEASERIIAMAKQAIAAGKRAQVSVQSAFGCGYEGAVPPERVLGLVRQYVENGITNISLADTAGHATPDQVARMYERVVAMGQGIDCACHFHDTYGLGLANVWAAMQAGVTHVETSVAGLGGCPFTKIAGGNVCTEDLVHMLQRMGRRQDVALEAIIGIANEVAAFFGREMPGMVYRTGPIPAAPPLP